MIRPYKWMFTNVVLLVAAVPSLACPLEPVVHKELAIHASSISEPLQNAALDAALISSEIASVSNPSALQTRDGNDQTSPIEGMASSIMSSSPLPPIDAVTNRDRTRSVP
jgi:hypothetical protein